MVNVDTEVRVIGPDHPWVSRGGSKLVHALDTFGIDVTGSLALDIGASTGGFTDVLLQRGARHVIALDVGHWQLHWKIRSDPRVTVIEGANARHLIRADLPASAPAWTSSPSTCRSSRSALIFPVAAAAAGAWRQDHRAGEAAVRGWPQGRGQEGAWYRIPEVHTRVVADR